MNSRFINLLTKGRVRKPLPLVSVEAELTCLSALRVELASSYPHIRTDQLLAIATEHGLDRFPIGFLVAGSIRGGGADSARSALDRVRGTSNGTPVTVHPLFSQAFYALANPDVASAGIVPWLHYQVHGRAEGRAPHPLIDTEFLAAWMPGVPRKNVVDHYLTDSDDWLADPGPYVDCRKFMVDGPWDGVTNPLLQIVAGHLVSSWVHARLQLVDTDSQSQQVARLTGGAFLLGTTGARSRLASIETWAVLEASKEPTKASMFTVVPGSFLGADKRVLWSRPSLVLSPDSTIVRLPTEILSLRAGETTKAVRLLNLEGDFEHSRLAALVSALPPGSAIAPYTFAQEESLVDIVANSGIDGLHILPFGRQVRVESAEVLREYPPAARSYDAWQPGPSEDGARSAFVFTDDELAFRLVDAGVKQMIAAGALVCVVGASGLTPWLPALKSRDQIICREPLAGLVATFLSVEIRVFGDNHAEKF
ncbi:hypothetical protein [Frigoribacterium sp. UYMn621]|uniref:hypothetical protein n=1 Tax=Frigoribacterium sp. UYMn621 TaxID=3156343 RepID=UPI003395BFF9